MEEEMKALIKNGKWTLIEPLKDRPVIGSKGILNGSYASSKMVMEIQFTLRLMLLLEVFQDTFSPTLNICGFRMLVTLATHDLELHHLDVETTFLHEELDDFFYPQPELF